MLIANESEARAAEITQLKAQIDEDITSQITTLNEALATESETRATQIGQLQADFAADIDGVKTTMNAGFTQVNQAIANESDARASSEAALDAKIGQNSAALNQKLDSWANVNGVGSMYAMKLGLTYNGQQYSSGMALQLTAQGSSVVSQVLFIADRFAIIRNAASGAYTLPFVVQNDQVFMNNALIQDGSITNAKIGNVIQSNNFQENVAGWRLDKTAYLSTMVQHLAKVPSSKLTRTSRFEMVAAAFVASWVGSLDHGKINAGRNPGLTNGGVYGLWLSILGCEREPQQLWDRPCFGCWIYCFGARPEKRNMVLQRSTWFKVGFLLGRKSRPVRHIEEANYR
ncbi:DUF1983 domain-containing protein (plasmid) [Paraclostridium bifermentans]|uniref:DUF1983 domain-containing protein n=1 Tax=Paraclostridium bifermentans TaxID=1490 RepID=A0ABY8R8J0_PARBF|nr:DUF1983 domain-containing protein [Paraclostridium bifermentans]